MPSVDRIKLGFENSLVRQNIKNTLGYAVKKRSGYYQDLKKTDERRGGIIDKFEMAGFIHIGRTLKEDTFSITKLGDAYYEELFGQFDYWAKRLLGALERLKNKIFNKGEK